MERYVLPSSPPQSHWHSGLFVLVCFCGYFYPQVPLNGTLLTMQMTCRKTASVKLSSHMGGSKLHVDMSAGHNTSDIAHQGRAGGTRPDKPLKGHPQAAKAAAKVDQSIL